MEPLPPAKKRRRYSCAVPTAPVQLDDPTEDKSAKVFRACCAVLTLVPNRVFVVRQMTDGVLVQKVKIWLSDHKPGKRRTPDILDDAGVSCVIEGNCMLLVLRDTTRYVRDPADAKQELKMQAVIDLAQVAVLEKSHQGRGLFASFWELFVAETKARKHWSYIYVESVLSERFRAFFSRQPGAFTMVGDSWSFYVPLVS